MIFLRRIHYLFRRNRLEADLAEELEFHQQMLREDGASAGEVRRAMGPMTLMREDSRAVWIAPWLQSVWQDLAYAVRGFRRQPGFTLVAVLALAFAIGLNTSLFTVFNAVALRPWAVADAGHVVKIFGNQKHTKPGEDRYRGFSLAELRYFAGHSKTMSGFVITRGEGGLHLDQAKVRADYVTGDFFKVLGVRMERGRGFLPDEDRLESPQGVAVLSYAAWQNQFGGDPGVISRQVRLDEVPFTIVGVAPPEFSGVTPERVDLWIPTASMSLLRPNDPWKADGCCLDLAGRLASGLTRKQASAELSVLSSEYSRLSNEPGVDIVMAGTPFLQQPGHKARQILAVFGLMFAAVMLVLLLACANVGNLLLARAAARRKEIGVRLSLGAGRRRLVRQFLTESLVLACAAGALGVGLAYVVPGPIFRSAVGDAIFSFSPDTTVLAYTLGLAFIACLAFGLAPALHATRGNFSDALKDRRVEGPRFTLRSVLLAVQVSVSVVLLVCAGLLVRSVQYARAQDPGFIIKGNAAITFDFPMTAYRTSRIGSFFQSLGQALDGLPGSQPYGLTDVEPLGSSHRFTSFHMPHETANRNKMIPVLAASPGYFDVLGIPILAGRNFQPADASRGVILVNQAMANRYFPGQNPIGKTIVIDKPLEIVGVVRDAYTWSLEEVEPTVYSPVRFGEPPHLILRNTPANLAAVESIARNLDARVQVQHTTLSANLDRWLSGSRAAALIAGMLGMLALSLATIGVAGVFAYAVQQRTQEIGIRMALGARPPQVTAVVLGWAARSLLIGLGIGLAGAIAASHLLRQFLFGLSPLDPIAYAAVLLTLALAGLAATYLPARRAVKLDPIRALRCD